MTAGAAVVTLSATYGALGSLIGPRVAERLQVPFLDRAIPAEVAQRLAVSLDEAEIHDERADDGFGRMLASFASVPMLLGASALPGIMQDERRFKDATERVLHAHVRDGGVILGRAGVLVLADHPAALHVRLDGPVTARRAQIGRFSGLDEHDIERSQRDADRAREAYVKHFYHRDSADPRLYHLILDSTVLDQNTCVELITTAARARTACPAPLPQGHGQAANQYRLRVTGDALPGSSSA